MHLGESFISCGQIQDPLKWREIHNDQGKNPVQKSVNFLSTNPRSTTILSQNPGSTHPQIQNQLSQQDLKSLTENKIVGTVKNLAILAAEVFGWIRKNFAILEKKIW